MPWVWLNSIIDIYKTSKRQPIRLVSEPGLSQKRVSDGNYYMRKMSKRTSLQMAETAEKQPVLLNSTLSLPINISKHAIDEGNEKIHLYVAFHHEKLIMQAS